MSEEGGHESFILWENQSWGLSNSDNNNNSVYTAGSSEEKSAGIVKNQQEQENNSIDESTRKNNKRGRGGGVKGGGAGGGVGEADDHEMHIWTERERRKKMRNMFSNLHALLPQLPPKADKSTIVDEAVNYIKTLQQTLQNLQKQKLERFQGAITLGYNSNEHKLPSLQLNTQKQGVESRETFLADQVSCSDVHNVSASATNVSNPLAVSHQFPVLFQTWTSSNVVLNICGNEAQICVCAQKKPGLFTNICYILEKHKIEMISAHVSSDSNQSMFMIQANASGASNQLTEKFQVEEMFKQAAAEIMCWVSS